ncbi:uncharacterized protein LOC123313022 [Coccinella septempunctata]|uniref:uncharacterized protein LOC123313022 n=1 Tax=Coccinella septempunctata TaxID=41139 RepID=UPI001D079A4C|nr:uncharacterized protein LOC123313022 [Coccinella septempunctata]
MLTGRDVFVLDPHSGEPIGPGEANTGLEQGSSLSPLLFDIYTASVAEEDTLIVQFADDFCVISAGWDLQRICERVNGTLDNVSSWMNDRGLQLSPSKSKVLAFHKGKTLPQLPRIQIFDTQVPWCNSVKYLGCHLDNKLKWRMHVENICGRAMRGINLLRRLTRVWWGSHPTLLLNVYKSLVRPHLDYATIFVGRCAQSLYNQLDRVQYQSLRIALGYMRSTPINVMLAESGEPPLKYRRRWLAFKFISRLCYVQNPGMMNLLQQLIRFKGFWNNRPIPAFVQATKEVLEILPDIDSSPILHCFKYSIQVHHNPIRYDTMGLRKEHVNNEPLFQQRFREKFEGCLEFFTDASKNAQGGVGIGVFSSTVGYSMSEGLPKYISVCTAEIVAIYRALQYIFSQEIKSSVILTDSMSSLQSIASWSLSADVNPFVLKIRALIHDIQCRNYSTKLIWIPGHTNIVGNERADSLAKIGANGPLQTQRIRAHPREHWPTYKMKIWREWENEWHDVSRQKGRRYAHLRTKNKITPKPWFAECLRLPRKAITTINRLRSGHCCSPEHLYRMKVLDNNNCECGEQGDLDHIFFGCSNNTVNCQTLYSTLVKECKVAPLTIYDCLLDSNLKETTINTIVAFISSSHIRL